MARLRNRQLKATFWTDGELLRWTRDKRFVYASIWSMSEDSGCVEDDPFEWKVTAWSSPFDTDITIEKLERWREEFIQAGKLIPYEAEGKHYFYCMNFHQHEQPRNPQPPDLPLPSWVKCQVSPSTDKRGRRHIVNRYLVDTEILTACLAEMGRPLPARDGAAPEAEIGDAPEDAPPAPAKKPAKTPARAALIQGRFDHWRETFPAETARLTLTDDRKRAISARLREGIAPETIDQAVTNAAAAPWWNGSQDGEWKADIKTICGKGSTVENLAAKVRKSKPLGGGETCSRCGSANATWRTTECCSECVDEP